MLSKNKFCEEKGKGRNKKIIYMWKILNKTPAFRHPYVSVDEWEIEVPNGKHKKVMMKNIPDAVLVFAITSDKKVLVLKQFFVSHMQKVYGLVAGFLDKELGPLETAKQELREEAGAEAGNWIELGKIMRDKWSTGYLYFYLATDVRIIGAQELEDEEDIDIELITLEQCKALLHDNRIHDIGAAYCAHRAFFYLDNHPKVIE